MRLRRTPQRSDPLTPPSNPVTSTDPKAAAPRPWTDEEIAQLHILAGQGLRIGVIALRLGRTHASVTHAARQRGIAFASFKSRPADDRSLPTDTTCIISRAEVRADLDD